MIYECQRGVTNDTGRSCDNGNMTNVVRFYYIHTTQNLIEYTTAANGSRQQAWGYNCFQDILRFGKVKSFFFFFFEQQYLQQKRYAKMQFKIVKKSVFYKLMKTAEVNKSFELFRLTCLPFQNI